MPFRRKIQYNASSVFLCLWQEQTSNYSLFVRRLLYLAQECTWRAGPHVIYQRWSSQKSPRTQKTWSTGCGMEGRSRPSDSGKVHTTYQWKAGRSDAAELKFLKDSMGIDVYLCLPDEKGPYQSLPQLARNYHLQSQKQMFLFFLYLSNVWGKSTLIMRYNTKQHLQGFPEV